MDFLQSLKDNPVVLLVIPVIFGIIAKFIKSEKLCKMVEAEWIGVSIEKFLLRFFPAKSYEQFVEGWVATVLDMGISFIKSVKRGILKNNLKRQAEKKVDPDILKAFNDALKKESV